MRSYTLEQKEKLIRKLRNDPRLFEDGKKSNQVGRLIVLLKRRCEYNWGVLYNQKQEQRLERWFSIQ